MEEEHDTEIPLLRRSGSAENGGTVTNKPAGPAETSGGRESHPENDNDSPDGPGLGLAGDLPPLSRPAHSRRGSTVVDGAVHMAVEKAADETHVVTAKEPTAASYNMFAKRRHYAQTFLDIALLVNNVSHLVSVHLAEPEGMRDLKKILMGLIITSIILQVVAAFMLFLVSCFYHLAENRQVTIMAGELEANSTGKAPPEIAVNGCCQRYLMTGTIESYETAILILDGLATGVILLVTILNVFISAFFQLHTNKKYLFTSYLKDNKLNQAAVRATLDDLFRSGQLSAKDRELLKNLTQVFRYSESNDGLL